MSSKKSVAQMLRELCVLGTVRLREQDGDWRVSVMVPGGERSYEGPTLEYTVQRLHERSISEREVKDGQ